MERTIVVKVHISGSEDVKILRYRACAGTLCSQVEDFVRQELSLNNDDGTNAIEWYSNELNRFVALDDVSAEIGLERMLTLYVNKTTSEALLEPRLMIKGREFDTSNGMSIGGKVIHINDYSGNREAGTGLNTWDGSVVLAKYFERNATRTVQGRRVLELGAGTGLAGIAAHVLGASMTVLTDLEYALGNLRGNVGANFDHVEEAGLIFVRHLDWFDVTTYVRPSHVLPSSADYGDDRWDVIIGADIVWLEELVPALVACLESLMGVPSQDSVVGCSDETLSTPRTVAYLSHQTRSQAVDDLLFGLLSRSFRVAQVPESDLDPSFVTERIKIYILHLKNDRI